VGPKDKTVVLEMPMTVAVVEAQQQPAAMPLAAPPPAMAVPERLQVCLGHP
jgi:hypothetical protein